VIFRADRATTIKNIFGNVIVAEGSGASVDVRKNGCAAGSTELVNTVFHADGSADQQLGVASASLVAGDVVGVCPNGFPATPVGAGAITVSVQ
jgi:hypothetical protein